MRKLMVLGALAMTGLMAHDGDDNDRYRDRDGYYSRDDARGRRERMRRNERYRDYRYGNSGNYGYRGPYGGNGGYGGYGNGGYGNGGYGGYGNRGGYGASPVDRALSDLNRLNSYRMDGHERDHIRSAQDHLYQFQQHWSSGKFDTGQLDKAIDNLNHLASADQVSPGDRRAISSDIQELRSFRSSRGNYGY